MKTICGFIISFVILISSQVYCLTCRDLELQGLPCLEVPKCGGSSATLEITQLSDGSKLSQSNSLVELCHDYSGLNIRNIANGQQFFPNSNYSKCNDAIYNLDVSEAFIAPFVIEDDAPYCYSEIDLSPGNEIYESGIYNPNLNHTGCSNAELDCSQSKILHSTEIKVSENAWISYLSIPWNILNCPSGCQKSSYCNGSAAMQSVYRANFYRVNELMAVSKCSSSVCEYMAWSPTFANPPAFHEPRYFGYLVNV